MYHGVKYLVLIYLNFSYKPRTNESEVSSDYAGHQTVPFVAEQNEGGLNQSSRTASNGSSLLSRIGVSMRAFLTSVLTPRASRMTSIRATKLEPV